MQDSLIALYKLISVKSKMIQTNITAVAIKSIISIHALETILLFALDTSITIKKEFMSKTPGVVLPQTPINPWTNKIIGIKLIIF